MKALLSLFPPPFRSRPTLLNPFLPSSRFIYDSFSALPPRPPAPNPDPPTPTHYITASYFKSAVGRQECRGHVTTTEGGGGGEERERERETERTQSFFLLRPPPPPAVITLSDAIIGEWLKVTCKIVRFRPLSSRLTLAQKISDGPRSASLSINLPL